MEPSDSSPSSSVVDLPPEKTGGHAPREVANPDSTSTGNTDLPKVPAAGEGFDKAAQLGIGTREGAKAIPGARHGNLRRMPYLAKLVALTLLANLLLLGTAGVWLYHHLTSDIEARLDAGMSKRLADTEEQNHKQAARLEELTAALSTAKIAFAERKNVPASSSAIPAALPVGGGLPAAQSELVLLKERNRLTAYADEAIAVGARAPYEKLWEALDDPRLANLAHAARAEILRVQNFYLGGSRIDRFDIPVATYFPDQGALKDSQLKDDQVIKLLREKKNPWEVRMKAANLLGMRRSTEAGDALAEAVKRDENLDVVKEAIFSFEQMTGFRARMFDAASLELWWKEYKATPTPRKPKPKAATAKAAAPNVKDGSATAVPAKQEKENGKKAGEPR